MTKERRADWIRMGFVAIGISITAGCGSEMNGGGSGSGGASSTSSAGGMGGASSSSSDGAGGVVDWSSSSSSSASSSSASSGSSGSGGSCTPAPIPGAEAAYPRCNDSSDCGGKPCVPVVPGGYRVCKKDIPVLPECNANCTQGTCYQYKRPWCKGFPGENSLECWSDECATNADCPAGYACAAGMTVGRPVNACIPAPCQVDADCTAEPGGICAPLNVECSTPILACVYPSDGCTTNSQCYCGHCGVIDGRASCLPGSWVPPV